MRISSFDDVEKAPALPGTPASGVETGQNQIETGRRTSSATTIQGHGPNLSATGRGTAGLLAGALPRANVIQEVVRILERALADHVRDGQARSQQPSGNVELSRGREVFAAKSIWPSSQGKLLPI